MTSSICSFVLMLLPCLHAVNAYMYNNNNEPMIMKLLGSIQEHIKARNENTKASVDVHDTDVDRRTACGGILTAKSGIISSSNFPNTYGNNERCDWTIQAPERTTIIVAFVDFDLESHATCAYDYVQVFNGPDLTSPAFAKACGTKAPATFRSAGNSVRIVFSSDHSVVKSGFRMTYIVDSGDINACPENWVFNAGSCYLFSRDQTSFEHAETNCQQQGGHLVHVNTPEENTFLKTKLRSLHSGDPLGWFSIWMGLTDKASEGAWKWIDTNTAPEMTDWIPGQPDNKIENGNAENCAVFEFFFFDNPDTDGKWRDVVCYKICSSVCEKKSYINFNVV